MCRCCRATCTADTPAGRRQRRFPRPGRLTLTVGTPLKFDDVPNDKQGWREVARRAEAAVRALATPA